MKLSRALEIALNGDAPNVDPAVRRALTSLAQQLDEYHIAIEDKLTEFKEELTADLGTAIERQEQEVKGVRRLLIGLTSSFIGAMLVGIANVLIGI